MKVVLDMTDARWKAGEIFRLDSRVLLVLSRIAEGDFRVTDADHQAALRRDFYTCVHQVGSRHDDGSPVMPGTVAVVRRGEADDYGKLWKLDGKPVLPITDSDEYRRRRDEWEVKR